MSVGQGITKRNRIQFAGVYLLPVRVLTDCKKRVAEVLRLNGYEGQNYSHTSWSGA